MSSLWTVHVYFRFVVYLVMKQEIRNLIPTFFSEPVVMGDSCAFSKSESIECPWFCIDETSIFSSELVMDRSVLVSVTVFSQLELRSCCGSSSECNGGESEFIDNWCCVGDDDDDWFRVEVAFPDGGECEFVADSFCGPFLSFTALSIILRQILF